VLVRALSYSRNSNEDWLIWVVVTGMSWVVGLLAAAVIAQGVSIGVPIVVRLAGGFIVGGAMIGLTQWTFLQPEARTGRIWMLATITGWTLGLLVTLFVARFANLLVVSLLGGASGGLIFGLAQWLVIIPKVRGRGDWLLMTISSWTAALTLGSLIVRKSQPLNIRPDFAIVGSSGVLGWVFIVLVSGIFLIFFFPKPDNHPFGGGDWWP